MKINTSMVNFLFEVRKVSWLEGPSVAAKGSGKNFPQYCGSTKELLGC
jgi:hypothetical protein